MSPSSWQPGRRLMAVYLVLAVLLAGAGGVLVGVGIAGQQHPPQPTAAQANPGAAAVITTTTITSTITSTSNATLNGESTTEVATTTSVLRPLPSVGSAAPQQGETASTPSVRQLVSTTEPATPTPTLLTLQASIPLTLAIPSIGVHSNLLQLGLNADKSIQVPPLQDPNSQAGWYKYSPTPGQIGPTVILGHVDSAEYGPGVFFDLGALQPGAAVDITLTNGIVAVFTVQKVVSYPKSTFPSAAVYGQTDKPSLRLITCGGTFNPDAGSYESNIVAYAILAASH